MTTMNVIYHDYHTISLHIEYFNTNFRISILKSSYWDWIISLMILLTLEPSFMTYMTMTRIFSATKTLLLSVHSKRKLASMIHELATLFRWLFLIIEYNLRGTCRRWNGFLVDNIVVVLVILYHMYIDKVVLGFILESVGHNCQDDNFMVFVKNSLISLFWTLILRMFFYYKD